MPAFVFPLVYVVARMIAGHLMTRRDGASCRAQAAPNA
jgi:hypothetical protein